MNKERSKKVLVLASGGLDSILTLNIMEKAGIDVVGIHFLTWFNIPKHMLPEDLSGEWTSFDGFRIFNLDISKEYTAIMLNPLYGCGSAANPCIDCKILFLKKAKELLGSFGADFVATGEVVGQRPMTGRSTIMKMIEKKSGLKGYLLRPLSARLLEPTIPEELGWVKREDFYGISGRGRKQQMELASLFAVSDYPAPAGGCLLTEKNFRTRFMDLVSHSSNIAINDLTVLRYGRHFRFSSQCKLVVGRDQKDNDTLERIKWGNIRIDVVNMPGPFSLMKWSEEIFHLRSALRIIARYSGYSGAPEKIVFRIAYGNKIKIISYIGKPDKILSDEKIIR